MQAYQRHSEVKNSVWSAEYVCDAVFKLDEFTGHAKLACIKPPLILPIAATFSDKCKGEYEVLKLNVGPHDARVFYGPKSPYTVYGSNSKYTCFGQFILDFRILYDWPYEFNQEKDFRKTTEIQRPKPYGDIEKNWFVFWDSKGQMYAHYDVYPQRAFAKMKNDGSVGKDLAPKTAKHDGECIAKYMPPLAPTLESIHQSTNSLSLSLCSPTGESSCEPDDTNTFIIHIFQHKTYYNFHSIYEPYVMLFRQTPPFELYAISTRPLWIHGRGSAGQGDQPEYHNDDVTGRPLDHSEMFYVTSISWKKQGMKYHGTVDDTLFITFGIEDRDTAAIDIRAGDLVQDLGLC